MSQKRVKVPPRRIEEVEELMGEEEVDPESLGRGKCHPSEPKVKLLKRGIVIGEGKLWQVRLNLGFGLVVFGLICFIIWMMVQ